MIILLLASSCVEIGDLQTESKTITIPADQAYGPYRADLVQVVARDQFPTDSELKVGQMLQARQPDGQIILVTSSA
jgi:peptidylprolyl isomerase